MVADPPAGLSRVALVTGASGAIGAAAARRLAAMGFVVAAHFHRAEADAQALVAELGPTALAVGGDLTDAARTDEVVRQVAEALGPIGVLVNAAGARQDGLLVRQTPEDWQQVVAVNLFGTYHASRAVLGPMLQARSGRIINVVSPSAFRAIPGQTAYAASKAAVVGLTRTLAKECGPRNVTVNAVSPGLVDSRMSEGIGEDAEERLLAWTALGRKTSAEEVAEAVAFLVANGGVTGVVLPVDGGMSL